jgi:glycosyltransferase involved in cell wall biosynthesis
VKIAVNTRFLLPGKLEGIGKVTYEVLRRLVHLMPETNFDFLFDRKFDPALVFNANVHPKVIFPPTRHPLLTHTWLQSGVKRYISKSKPDLYFSFDGFMVLGISIPSIITIHDLAYAHFPQQNRFADRWYYQRYMPMYAQESAHIITVSKFSQNDISTRFHLPMHKVTAIYNGVSEEFQPVTTEISNRIRAKYAASEPYFLYVGAIHPRKNLARLIQAFDQYKSTSGSPMKLLITGKKGWLTKPVEKAFENSKSRSDIIFTGFVPQKELSALIGSAEALCYVSLFEGFGLPIVEAMATGVPVLCSNRNSMAEIAGHAAILVDPENINDIAKGLHQLERDKNLRKKLITTGLERSKLYRWDRTAEQYRDVLQRFL